MIGHIVLLVLKIIGCFLLALLCLVVLVAGLVLFTPLRYECEAGCKGTKETLWAKFKFSFLFRLIKGNVEYQDGKTKWHLRIAWKTLSDEASKDVMEASVEIAEDAAEDTVKEEPVETAEDTVKEEPTEVAEDAVKEESVEVAKDAAGKSAETAKKAVKEPVETAKEKQTTVKAEADSLSEKKTVQKKQGFFERIEYTFQRFCDKMNVLIEKKERVFSFLEDEIHRAAFGKAISSLKKLAFRLKPKTLSGNVQFGFDDPSVTGKLLALISVISPIFEGNLDIDPRFDEKILLGEILIVGKITAWKFMAFVLELLMDRNIRKTILHIKNFKL